MEGSDECQMDKLLTYDDVGPLSPPLCGQGPGCVGNFPNSEIVSHNRRMTAELVTDGSVNATGVTLLYKSEGWSSSQ